MKAAFISALAVVAGNVAYCSDQPDIVCSTSRGGKICGNDPCNDLISALANEDSIKVQSTEEGEFTVLGSDMETGCELTIAPLDGKSLDIDAGYIAEDFYNILDTCAGNNTNAQWSGSVSSDRGGEKRLVEIYNPVDKEC